MEKVLVTGVNGFVGGHLVNELLAQGFEVVGVGREEKLGPELAAKVSAYYACDLADYESVKKIPFTDVKAVINLAGLAAVGPSFDNPELYMRINTAVLDTVCKAAVEQGAKNIRILSISSGAIYSPNQSMPLTEESKTAPESSPYAASKIAMEELSLKYRDEGLDCVVARPFNHIGPGQMEGFLLPDLYKKVTESHLTGEPLLVGNLTTKRDYTDVRDVAKAYVKLISSQELNHGIYNVCTGKSVSGEIILAKLLAELQLTDVNPQVDESQFRPSDTPELFGDNSRLKSDTSWEPQTQLEQTIADYVAWAKAR
jgi:GDP-4-dehydro-6-deoxy-D-mannose reductase